MTDRESGEVREGTNRKFNCRDAGMDCDWATRGRSDEEIMGNVQEHVHERHGTLKWTDELKNRIRGMIQDVRHRKAA